MENHLAETRAVGVRLRELKGLELELRELKEMEVEGFEGDGNGNGDGEAGESEETREAREREVRDREKERMRISGLFGGKGGGGVSEGRLGTWNGKGRTAVLARKSIWGLGLILESGSEPEPVGHGDEERGVKVAWPRLDELKAEGEMQVRQGLTRRLPLPKLNLLKTIDKSELINNGEAGKEEVVKMEKGTMPMPFRMKVAAPVEEFDETCLGREDRFARGLTKFAPKATEKAEEIDEREVRQRGLLGDLLDSP